MLSLLREWKATRLYANIEYEVDELRRDVKVCELAKKEGEVACSFLHDKCVVPPGEVKTRVARDIRSDTPSGTWRTDNSARRCTLLSCVLGFPTSLPLIPRLSHALLTL